MLGFQEDSGDNYDYFDNYYRKEITVPSLMFPWGLRALNIKGDGTETTHHVVIRKIPMFFQSHFQFGLVYIFTMPYNFLDTLGLTAFFSSIFSL